MIRLRSGIIAGLLVVTAAGCDLFSFRDREEEHPTDLPETHSEYFPLAVGNEWHTSGSVDNGYWTVRIRTKIVVSREAEGAPGHFLVEHTSMRTDDRFGTTSTTSVETTWNYDPTTQKVMSGDSTVTPCPLGAEPGTTAACDFGQQHRVDGGLAETVTIGTQQITVDLKEFVYSPDNPQAFVNVKREFARGIGQLSYSSVAAGGSGVQRDEWELVYARIGESVYGEPAFTQTGTVIE
jgi:hypothetical protein